MESWQDEIIKAQISQEIGVERSMENSDISVFLKSFKENLIGAVDRDSFDKSWSSDLQSKFPNGVWRTVNGAKVFINNGKVIAGLDGFNGEIDKFFEGRGKKESGKSHKAPQGKSESEGKLSKREQGLLDAYNKDKKAFLKQNTESAMLNPKAALENIDNWLSGSTTKEYKDMLTEVKKAIEAKLADPKNTMNHLKEVEDSIPKSKDGLYQIYLQPIRNKDGSVKYMYGVPSIKNKEHRGFGDGLHDNLEDAIKEVELNRKKELLQEKQKEDRLAAERKLQEEEQKRKEANKGKTKLEIMNEAKAQKVLNSKVSINGTIKTKKEHVQDVIRNGGKVGTAEVNKYKGVSRSRYNRMNNREQEELERKIKEGGKKTEYRLYTKDGTFYVISKTEYDYANQISNK